MLNATWWVALLQATHGMCWILRLWELCATANRKSDLPAPVGSPVLAPVSGLVVRPTNPGRDGYGDQVRIVDADGRLYILGHLSSTNVQPGAYVNAGQQVGEVGRSGNSPQNGASHLHLEVRDQNNQSIRLNSTPATDPAGAAAGLENYRDSLPSSRPSQAPQMRTPTPPLPRQAQPLSMLDRLLDFIIPSAAASTSNGASLNSNESTPAPRVTVVFDDTNREQTSTTNTRNQSAANRPCFHIAFSLRGGIGA